MQDVTELELAIAEPSSGSTNTPARNKRATSRGSEPAVLEADPLPIEVDGSTRAIGKAPIGITTGSIDADRPSKSTSAASEATTAATAPTAEELDKAEQRKRSEKAKSSTRDEAALSQRASASAPSHPRPNPRPTTRKRRGKDRVSSSSKPKNDVGGSGRRSTPKSKAKNDPVPGSPEPRVVPDEVSVLVQQIRAEQDRIRDGEGQAVTRMIAIGCLLVALKIATKPARSWTLTLAEIGYAPRVASRFQKLGIEWGGENGRIATDLLPMLPADLNKLERLCDLTLGQLRALLFRIDCRKESRATVSREVNSALGIDPKPREKLGRSRIIERFKKSVQKVAITVGDSDMEESDRVACHEDLRRVLV